MNETMKEIMTCVLVTLIIAAAFSIPVMIVWNILIPDICGFTPINIYQAFGINILMGILNANGSGSGSSNKK